MSNELLISQIEKLIRRDPARRGLIGSDGNGPGCGELTKAASLFLSDHAVTGAGLMTGFFIPAAIDADTVSLATDKPAGTRLGSAETDGPLGTFVLADVLAGLGIPTTVITDRLCENVVRTACSDPARNTFEILVSPNDRADAARWRAEVLQRTALQQLSHFVAIERVGPGYDSAELAGQHSESTINQPAESAPTEWQPGHCCNMRGQSIDAFSADLHLLIEDALKENSDIKVIGIGDGGNEIGMGRFPREELLGRINGLNAERVPCRISADATIVAGVSNWGAYALAAAIAVHHGRIDLLDQHSTDSQRQLLEKIVSAAGAVDGVTRKNEPTVDGLPFLTQIQPWIAIRELLGLRP